MRDVLQFPYHQPMHGDAQQGGIMIKGTFFRTFKGRKITKIEVNGEKFTVHFENGESLENLNINELNHVIVSATGR